MNRKKVNFFLDHLMDSLLQWSLFHDQKKHIIFLLHIQNCLFVSVTVLFSTESLWHSICMATLPLASLSTNLMSLNSGCIEDIYWNKNYSSRMRTSRLETVHASVSVATTRCCSQGVTIWTSLNRSPVSLEGMSPGPMSKGGFTFLGGVPYYVTYPMMHLMLATAPWTDGCL